jgi:hypothetical protein
MCGVELPVGTIAVYGSSTKSVTCPGCLPKESAAAPQLQGPDLPAN